MKSAWVYLLAGAAVLAACGKDDDKKAASQVAATVNSQEITVHQVNNVLARNPSITPEAAPRAKREIVERLIDQELARQQALEKKLDRSPGVVQAIEAAKAKSMQEIGDWLKSREVQFAVNRGGRAAEQIPLEVLPMLQKMKEGEIQVIEAADRVNVIRVVTAKTVPVDEATAAPRIQQFLFSRRSNEVIAQEMKRLKEHARIEYVGEFSAATPAAAKPAAAAAPKEAASPEASIEKGVRGLQ